MRRAFSTVLVCLLITPLAVLSIAPASAHTPCRADLFITDVQLGLNPQTGESLVQVTFTNQGDGDGACNFAGLAAGHFSIYVRVSMESPIFGHQEESVEFSAWPQAQDPALDVGEVKNWFWNFSYFGTPWTCVFAEADPVNDPVLLDPQRDGDVTEHSELNNNRQENYYSWQIAGGQQVNIKFPIVNTYHESITYLMTDNAPAGWTTSYTPVGSFTVEPYEHAVLDIWIQAPQTITSYPTITYTANDQTFEVKDDLSVVQLLPT